MRTNSKKGVERKKAKGKSRRLKHLDDWDWTTLVASWRYFEYRMTIASSMFPDDIIQRYFSGAYDEDSCKRIAHQFAETDHGLRGEKDWTDVEGLRDCDMSPWCRFYAFCKGYCDGFKTVVLDGEYEGKPVHEEVKAFYCAYTKHWHGVEKYLQAPYHGRYLIDEMIKEVKEPS